MEKSGILFALLLAVVLAACSRPAGETLDRAQASLDSGSYREAVIDLKSVLQAEPDNARARWLLGRAYIAIEDGEGAEKELRRAQALGVDDDAVVPLLAQALLMQNKSDDVLGLAFTAPGSAESAAELDASKGFAHLAKGDAAAAAEHIGDAIRQAPDAPFVQLANAAFLAQQGEIDRSKVVLRSLVESDPDNGRAWSMLGKILYGEKAYGDAEDAYSNAIKHRVNNAGDRLQRGFSRLAKNDLAGAARDAEHLQEHAPRLPQVEYLAGRVAFHQGRFADALESFEKAYEQNGKHFQTVFLFAMTSLLQGHDERALGLAEQAYTLYPRHIPTRKLLARLYLQRDQGVGAEQLLSPIVASMPDDTDAKELLAASLMQQGRADEATGLLEAVASKRPDDAKAQLRAGIGLIASEQGASGAEAMQRAVELAPGDREVVTAAVASLLRANRAADALGIAQRFVQRSAQDPAAWNLLGHAQMSAGEDAKARESFAHVLTLAPGDPSASSKLVDLAMRDGDLVGAQGYLQRSLGQHPDDPNLLYRQGLLLQAQGDTNQAHMRFEQAVRSGQSPLPAHVAYANSLIARGEPAEALRVLADVDKDRDISVALTRADAHAALSEFAEARRILETLRSRTPDLPGLASRLARIYAQMGDRAALGEAVERALAEQPDDTRVRLVKVMLLAMEGDFAAAETLLETSGLPDDDAALLSARLFLERSRGDKAKEVAAARRLLAVQPSTANALALAAAQTRAGDAAAAAGGLERWIAGRPTDVAALRSLADIYVGDGKIEHAMATWESIVEIEPDNVVALNNLAWYSREKDPSRGLGYAERAFREAPESPAVLHTYSDALARAGNPDLALRTIDAAVKKSGGQAAFRLRRAEILETLGRRQDAIDATRSLLQEDLPTSVRDEAASLLARWDP